MSREPKKTSPLLSGELFQIHAKGRIVFCTISIPRGLLPQQGAAAAEKMADYLVSEVLVRGSPWLGLVLDVTAGPSVVGPRTHTAADRVFRSAEQSRKPLAVLVLRDGAQWAQFEALRNSLAPRYVALVHSETEARDWMTAQR
ncbi:MAG TPA: hypothetical protein VHM70_22385 [Polyangiaceae bacterium]|nr:hypothetical protein [Polyangiaceae bacterium]